MSMDLFDRSIFALINTRAQQLEERLKADVVFYHGRIHPVYFRSFRDFIEEVKANSSRTDSAIAVFLRTAGGSAEIAERMVSV